jgi:hypothetical protein
VIFLVEHDRPAGQLITFLRFDDSDRQEAEAPRLQTELDLHRGGVKHEVVTLEAHSEATVRRTHRRYFETLDELAKPVKGTPD